MHKSDKYSKNVLLIEFTPSHGELLYSQIKFLKKSNYEVFVFVHEDNRGDFELADYIHTLPSKSKFVFILASLIRFVIKHKIKKIIFNTAHGLLTRNAILGLLPLNVECFGIIHQAEKIYSSITQKIISMKIKKYFVLSDHILRYFEGKTNKSLAFSSFYPIYFPYQKTLVPIEDKFIVCIPGGIEFERKDYFGLIKILSENRYEIPENLIFRILGNASSDAGKNLQKAIDEAGLSNYFELYNEFLSNKDFFELLHSSDVILPLIQPGASEYKVFLQTSVSGAFNLAFYAEKPLILFSIFENLDEYKDFSFFYDSETLLPLFRKLIENPSLTILKTVNISQAEKFCFSFQDCKFVQFLNK